MDDSEDIKQPKKRGRPKGSKNKPKGEPGLAAGIVVERKLSKMGKRLRKFAEDGARVYKFPSAGPAKGVGKGPANGMGWGGPPKGPGQPGDNERVKAWRAMGLDEKRDYAAERIELAQKALDIMVDIMERDTTSDMLKLAAAEKVRNQIMGTPIQRTIVDKQPIKRDVIDPADLTQEERDAMRSVLEKAAQKRVGQE